MLTRFDLLLLDQVYQRAADWFGRWASPFQVARFLATGLPFTGWRFFADTANYSGWMLVLVCWMAFVVLACDLLFVILIYHAAGEPSGTRRSNAQTPQPEPREDPWLARARHRRVADLHSPVAVAQPLDLGELLYLTSLYLVSVTWQPPRKRQEQRAPRGPIFQGYEQLVAESSRTMQVARTRAVSPVRSLT